MVETRQTPIPRRALAVVGAASIALGLAACSPPGESGSQASTTPTAASTDIGTKPVTLTLYDGAGLKTIDDALIAAFTKDHPNITIKTRYDPDNVQAVNAPRVLASDTPPDIARIVALSDIVKSRLVTDLGPWKDAYSWEIPDGQLAQYTVDADGVRGSGTQYTLASGFTATGFYYNVEMMKRLGIEKPPATVSELESDLTLAKQQNITPIMAGNQTGGVVTSLQFLMNENMGRDAINGWIFHQPKSTVNNPEGQAAAKTIQDWAKAGYFNEDTNGTDGSGALGRFAKGESLFFASGNWDASALQKQMTDNVGFFLPPTGADGKTLAMSDPVSNFGIPAKSKNKDAAAAFLNFLLSPQARQILVDNGFAPSGSGEQPTTNGSLSKQVQEAFADLVTADGQVQFVQNASNGTTAVWNAQVQLLVAGKTTPEAMMQAVQAQYEQDLDQ